MFAHSVVHTLVAISKLRLIIKIRFRNDSYYLRHRASFQEIVIITLLETTGLLSIFWDETFIRDIRYLAKNLLILKRTFIKTNSEVL